MRSHAKAPSTGSVWIAAAAAFAAALLLLAVAASPASATIEAAGAGNIEARKDSATLNGFYVSAEGKETHYYFEWGETEAYGNTTPLPPGAVAGTGVGPQGVPGVQISGLHAEASYHVRLVVSDADGIFKSPDTGFTTAPAVTNLSADPASAINTTSAELHGSFDGDSTYATSYYFEWGPTTSYGNTTPAPPGPSLPAGEGRIDLPAVQVTGLEERHTYHYRVVATNATGKTVSADASLRTKSVGAPIVGNINSRDLQPTSAELTGSVNPRLGDTTYRFDWGPTTAYGRSIPVPDGDAGSGDAPVAVSARLEGLTAGITYHFRLVASNQYGSDASPDQSFGFYPPSCPNAQVRAETRSNSLPDCRAYELVTPGFAQGTTVFPQGGPPAPFATNPPKLAYTATFGQFPEAGDASNVMGDMYVSTRTDSGWYQRFVGRKVTETMVMGGPPRSNLEGISLGSLGPGTMMTGTQVSPSLDRLASYDRGWPDNQLEKQWGHPSNAPYVWDTSSGSLRERLPTNLFQITGGEDFVGIPELSSDFTHFVFQSNIPFAAGGTKVDRTILCCAARTPDPPAEIYDNNLETGTVELASIKGGSETEAFAGFVFDISEDGTRILMSTENKNPPRVPLPPGVQTLEDVEGPLYLRVDGERTIEIAPGRKITYVGSTDDGATIYLRSQEQLTSEDLDQSTDLYVWHEADGRLDLVSIGDSAAGNGDECGGVTWNGGGCNVEIIEFIKYTGLDNGNINSAGQGGNGGSDTSLASKSGDIYFISPEELLEGQGDEGRANLYLYRKGALKFVAALNPQGVCGPVGCSNGAVARMQVTPDGSHMAFVAASNVTGYDSAGHAEMYTYNPETEQIVCASCLSSGEPPLSDVGASHNGLFQAFDGRVFFNTGDALVPRDTNGLEDVYEYSEGRSQLITAGTGKSLTGTGGVIPAQSTTGLIGVSADGTNVYFGTVDTLVTQDHNGGVLKIYNARTGGGFPAERTPPDCQAADECHGPGVSAPSLPPDRTSAALGSPAKKHKAKKHKAKKHKAKKHKRKAHRKHGNAKGSKKAQNGSRKAGGARDHG